jgi:hypothetical protein
MADEEKKEGAEKKEETFLEWNVHLFRRERRYRSALALLAVLTAVVGGFVLVREPIAVAAYIIILFFALGAFFFPVKYRITDRGAYSIAWTGARFMAWERVRRAYKNEHGVKLSIFEHPSPLEAYRGMFMRYGDRKNEILSLVRRLAQGRSAGTA